MNPSSEKTISLVLGSGGARGLAHIGVIRTLERHGWRIGTISGSSIGALIGEWVGASSGLGYAMLQANARSQTAVMFACLFLLAAMSVLLRAGVDFFTRDLTPWVPETT